jgi:hypothetical protein
VKTRGKEGKVVYIFGLKRRTGQAASLSKPVSSSSSKAASSGLQLQLAVGQHLVVEQQSSIFCYMLLEAGCAAGFFCIKLNAVLCCALCLQIPHFKAVGTAKRGKHVLVREHIICKDVSKGKEPTPIVAVNEVRCHAVCFIICTAMQEVVLGASKGVASNITVNSAKSSAVILACCLMRWQVHSGGNAKTSALLCGLPASCRKDLYLCHCYIPTIYCVNVSSCC